MARQHPTVQPQQSVQYTQNFFYGILAAGHYTLIAILLVIYTVSVYPVRLSYQDRRKVECTSIILRTISFAVFLIGGAAVYSTIEGWSLVDALYFTDYTLLTIGIGNIVPQTHLGRSLLFPYAAGGITALGLVISSIASFARNMRDMKLRFQLKEARDLMRERKDSSEPNHSNHGDNERPSSHVLANTPFPRRIEVLNLYRTKSEFNRRRQLEELLFFLAAWFILWLVSAVVFRRTEKSQGWSYFEALYFTYTSLTTIGYGDLYPTSNFGKTFFVFWSLLAIPVLTSLVTAMGEVGLRAFSYFSGYVWRLGSSRAHARQCHRDGIFPRARGRRSNNREITTAFDSEPLDGGTDVERHAQGPSMTRQSPKDLRKLRLAEEIEKLVAALMDESIRQDLYGDWARILSLLHAGEDEGIEGSNSLEPPPAAFLHHRAPLTRRKLMSPEKAVAERNTEILWMLKLSVEKLCSDLRLDLPKN